MFQHVCLFLCLAPDKVPSLSLQETYEQKRAEHLEELQRIENEMRQNFVNKVREKDLELKRNEKEVIFVGIC